MLTREEKDAWIARLRDPNSKQARGGLIDGEGGMCCIEHFCVAMNAELPSIVASICESQSTTPDNMHHYKFLEDKLGHDWTRFSNMNDGIGDYVDNSQSLTQIADWIEANLPVQDMN